MLGKRHSEETKIKMSESHKAKMTDEYRAKLSNSQKGVKRKFHHRKPLSKESCKKISDAKKGKHFGGRGITLKKSYVLKRALFITVFLIFVNCLVINFRIFI